MKINCPFRQKKSTEGVRESSCLITHAYCSPENAYDTETSTCGYFRRFAKVIEERELRVAMLHQELEIETLWEPMFNLGSKDCFMLILKADNGYILEMGSNGLQVCMGTGEFEAGEQMLHNVLEHFNLGKSGRQYLRGQGLGHQDAEKQLYNIDIEEENLAVHVDCQVVTQVEAPSGKLTGYTLSFANNAIHLPWGQKTLSEIKTFAKELSSMIESITRPK